MAETGSDTTRAGAYGLTDIQKSLKAAAANFAKNTLAPQAMAADRDGRDFPLEVLREMAAQGFLGLDVPQEYSGQGFDTLTCAVIAEELAGGWFSSTIYAMNLATGPLLSAASPELRARFLPGICRGEIIPAFCLTEPEGGSDAAAIRTRAVRDGSDYVLDGQKIFITNAHRADILTVFARTAKDAERGKGISMFLVEKGTPGLVVGQRFATMAHSANPISEVAFDSCRIPAENLVGLEGEGFSYIQRDFAKIRAVYGSRCVGVAQAAIDYALQYGVERVQFGQPIATFQSMRFRAADIVTKIEAARQLSYRAAVSADAMTDDAPVAASMAKLFGANMAVEVTGEALQMMGGHGFIKDHPVERYYREAKLFQIGDGTNEMLRLLISRHANRCASDKQSARLE